MLFKYSILMALALAAGCARSRVKHPDLFSPGKLSGDDGCARGDAQKCFDSGSSYRERNDMAMAADYFERGCNLKDQSCCYNLGHHLWKGEGRPADLQGAARLYRRACVLGMDEACDVATEIEVERNGDRQDLQTNQQPAEARQAEAQPAEAHQAEAHQATVQMTSTAAVQVWIDGAYTGSCGPSERCADDVEPGHHEIVVKLLNEDGWSEFRSIDVAPGAIEKIFIDPPRQPEP